MLFPASKAMIITITEFTTIPILGDDLKINGITSITVNVTKNNKENVGSIPIWVNICAATGFRSKNIPSGNAVNEYHVVYPAIVYRKLYAAIRNQWTFSRFLNIFLSPPQI